MNRVKSYAGSSYPEQPRALVWEGQQYQVQEIVSRSREPEGLRFLVRCSPGNALFDLYYPIEDGDWQIQQKGFVTKA
ncbi:MAG: hypothetical protein SVP52_07305 [Chloroflexota bacterium]|nr:hypothetical protein [Chloroflexota bacterium]